MYEKSGLKERSPEGKKERDNQEELRYYNKVNIGLTSLEELRKKLISSPKYKDTVLIRKENLEIFLQNILLALEDINLLVDGYVNIKERADLLNHMFLQSSEHENFFLNKLMEAQRKEWENVA